MPPMVIRERTSLGPCRTTKKPRDHPHPPIPGGRRAERALSLGFQTRRPEELELLKEQNRLWVLYLEAQIVQHKWELELSQQELEAKVAQRKHEVEQCKHRIKLLY